jgi:hypothetical protein
MIVWRMSIPIGFAGYTLLDTVQDSEGDVVLYSSENQDDAVLVSSRNYNPSLLA